MRWIMTWVAALALACGGVHAAPAAGTLHQLVCQAVLETVLQQDNGAAKQLRTASALLDQLQRSKVDTFSDQLSQIGRLVRPGEPLSADRLATFSAALNTVLESLQPQHEEDPINELPERIEYLTVLYVARNEIGALRPARELHGSYLGLDIPELAQSIDHDMRTLELQQSTSSKQQDALQRWSYIRKQFFHFKTLPPSSLSVSVQGRYISAALRANHVD